MGETRQKTVPFGRLRIVKQMPSLKVGYQLTIFFDDDVNDYNKGHTNVFSIMNDSNVQIPKPT